MKIDRMLHETAWLSATGEEVRTVFVQTGLSEIKTMQTDKETVTAEKIENEVDEHYRQCLESFQIPTGIVDKCHIEMRKLAEQNLCIDKAISELRDLEPLLAGNGYVKSISYRMSQTLGREMESLYSCMPGDSK
jgi:hypothetical protein